MRTVGFLVFLAAALSPAAATAKASPIVTPTIVVSGPAAVTIRTAPIVVSGPT
jgi:hypothetical protein